MDLPPDLQLLVRPGDEARRAHLDLPRERSRLGAARLCRRCAGQLVPDLGTVLANEEVIDGKSEVGGFPVVRRPMRQWMLRITAYAERLSDELEGLDWPEGIK